MKDWKQTHGGNKLFTQHGLPLCTEMNYRKTGEGGEIEGEEGWKEEEEEGAVVDWGKE